MKDIPRDELPRVRDSLARLGAIVAEVDRDLRYVWIDNKHRDYEGVDVLGRRDGELMLEPDAAEVMSLKRLAFERGERVSRILHFYRPEGVRYYSFFLYPIREADGSMRSLLSVAFNVPGGAP